MKLDKSQRFTAYCIMLAEIEDYWSNDDNMYRMGFCFLIWDLFRIENIGNSNNENYQSINTVTRFFSELEKKRVFDTHNGWPPLYDLLTRVELLKKCIEETADY